MRDTFGVRAVAGDGRSRDSDSAKEVHGNSHAIGSQTLGASLLHIRRYPAAAGSDRATAREHRSRDRARGRGRSFAPAFGAGGNRFLVSCCAHRGALSAAPERRGGPPPRLVVPPSFGLFLCFLTRLSWV